MAISTPKFSPIAPLPCLFHASKRGRIPLAPPSCFHLLHPSFLHSPLLTVFRPPHSQLSLFFLKSAFGRFPIWRDCLPPSPAPLLVPFKNPIRLMLFRHSFLKLPFAKSSNPSKNGSLTLRWMGTWPCSILGMPVPVYQILPEGYRNTEITIPSPSLSRVLFFGFLREKGFRRLDCRSKTGGIVGGGSMSGVCASMGHHYGMRK